MPATALARIRFLFPIWALAEDSNARLRYDVGEVLTVEVLDARAHRFKDAATHDVFSLLDGRQYEFVPPESP